MFRMWGKIWKNNHLLKDVVICNEESDTRTHKIFKALDEICYEFDLGKPIWLDSTISEFKRHSKARFTQDNFIETVDFDYLEIHVIEEDQCTDRLTDAQYLSLGYGTERSNKFSFFSYIQRCGDKLQTCHEL